MPSVLTVRPIKLVVSSRDRLRLVHALLFRKVCRTILKTRLMSTKIDVLLNLFRKFTFPPADVLSPAMLTGIWEVRGGYERNGSGGEYGPWVPVAVQCSVRIWEFGADGILGERAGEKLERTEYVYFPLSGRLYIARSGVAKECLDDIYYVSFTGEKNVSFYDLEYGKRTPEDCRVRFDLERVG